MKKIIYIFIIVAIAFTTIKAQTNLVPNGSFEDTVNCPYDFGQISYSKYWFNPNTASADYFNKCYDSTITFGNGVPSNLLGYQNAYNGSAYAGIMASEDVTWNINYREYAGVKLLSSLTSGIVYYFSMYISLSDSSRYATSRIGAMFSTDSIQKNNYDTINRIPQIENPIGNFITNKNSWYQIRGSFSAVGGETYLYIGNFHPHNQTDTLAIINGGNSNSYNLPYYYIDFVCLSTDSNYSFNTYVLRDASLDLDNKIIIFPNPINDNLYIENKYNEKLFLQIYSSSGENVLSFISEEKTISINTLNFNKGLYFIKASLPSGKTKTSKIIKL